MARWLAGRVDISMTDDLILHDSLMFETQGYKQFFMSEGFCSA